MGTNRDQEPITTGRDDYEWPVEPDEDPAYRPGFYMLAILYSTPVLVLILFPALAWLALLPFSITLRWNAHPPHRRRLIWLYVGTGLVSLAPWISLIFR